MNKREAKIQALRFVASLAETSIGGGFEPADNEADDEKIFAAMREICQALENRADKLERSSPRPPEL
jgi:hypothetical protein